MDFRSKLFRMLYGRYITFGIDSLTKFVFALYLLLAVSNIFISKWFWPAGIGIYAIETALLIWTFCRLMSKNIAKRQAENQPFFNIENKIKSTISLKKRIKSEKKTHVYKKCPQCSAMLRLPRKKGKHNTRCPRCKNEFSVKVR